MSLQDLPSSAAGTSLGAAKGGALRPGTPRIGPLRGKGGVRRGRAPGGAGSPELYRDPGADSEMPARRGACPRLLRPPPATPPRWGRFSPFTAESLPAHKGGVSALLATAPDFWWRLYFPAGTRRTEGPPLPVARLQSGALLVFLDPRPVRLLILPGIPAVRPGSAPCGLSSHLRWYGRDGVGDGRTPWARQASAH